MAFELSTVFCRPPGPRRSGCAWHHGAWQYLRLLNLVAAPTWHAAFYDRALQAVLRGGERRRVLVTGASDYTMLAQVLWSARRLRVPPQISIVDLCETPLVLCRWYAARTGARVRTVAADVLEFEPDGRYDLIVSDALLPRFARQSRDALLTRWHDLLTPHGRVVTTEVLASPAAPRTQRLTPLQVERYRRIARREARAHRHLRLSPSQLGRLAGEFAARSVGYALRSEPELVDALGQAALRPTELEACTVESPVGASRFVRLVARRSASRPRPDGAHERIP